MCINTMADSVYEKKKRLNPVQKMTMGLDYLFREYNSVFLLKIKNCNGDEPISFSEASCSTADFYRKFNFPSFFQTTLAEAAETLDDNNTDISKLDSDLFQRLLKVLEKSQVIAQKFKRSQFDKKRETDYTIQLAHHLLTPLSLHKEYMIDKYSRKQADRCPCCDEEISAKFEDTSIGHEKVWHGSTDILIGETKMVPVTVRIDDACDDDEEEPNVGKEELCPTSSEIIAETIVFALLQTIINGPDMDSLIPTISISKEDVRIYFYDGKEDFLLRSSPMQLFTDGGKDLKYDTVVALWLAVNYHVTCTGLTENVVNTQFRADFMKKFDEDVRELYKRRLRFRDCRPKGEDKLELNEYQLAGGYPKPYIKRSYTKCFTEKHWDIVHAKSLKVLDD